jgi:hypothetical protein
MSAFGGKADIDQLWSVDLKRFFLAAIFAKNSVIGFPMRSKASQLNTFVAPVCTHFDGSLANAFRTFDWDMPNCRAIRDGVMPALNAARTALIRPRVNETSALSTCRRRDLSVADDRFGKSDERRDDGVG